VLDLELTVVMVAFLLASTLTSGHLIAHLIALQRAFFSIGAYSSKKRLRRKSTPCI
jgi:hypothetical protein